MCCLHGVLHHDVKMEKLLINRETSEVKFIDFTYKDILRRSPYKSKCGMYCIIYCFCSNQSRTIMLCQCKLTHQTKSLSSRHSSILLQSTMPEGSTSKSSVVCCSLAWGSSICIWSNCFPRDLYILYIYTCFYWFHILMTTLSKRSLFRQIHKNN